MLKRWLVVTLLLALPALANVAQDDGTVQVGDPDGRGGTPPVASPEKKPGTAARPGPGPSGQATGGGGVDPESSATSSATGPGNPGGGTGQGGAATRLSPDELARQLDAPMPMENPYKLVAVGILLLLLALVGGLYFYRNRDREEVSD